MVSPESFSEAFETGDARGSSETILQQATAPQKAGRRHVWGVAVRYVA